MGQTTGKLITAADLFCGAGGTSSGLLAACEAAGYSLDLLAINHWQVAIGTHSKNHVYAKHLCEDLDSVNPRKIVPSGHLDLLVASPECTHHSVARGGRPINDQSRATAWHVLRWAEALRIDNILIENVPEFQTWGPLRADGKPMQARKGEIYIAFLNALHACGYNVDARVLNAADYGDPTTRQRLFILAKRRGRVVWPEPTHAPRASADLCGSRKAWRAAREIIDWRLPSQSIFKRKKPLSDNTLRRIAAGLHKFGGKEFLTILRGCSEVRSVDEPAPTITNSGAHLGVVEPFLVRYNGSHARKNDGDHRVHSVEDPVPTLDTSNRYGVCEPFLIQMEHSKREGVRRLDEPMPTVTSADAFGLAEPFLVHTNHQGGDRVHSIDSPVPTVTGAHRGEMGLAEPFLVKFFRTGRPASVDDPLDTVTAKDRFGLVIPDGYTLDIRFRMLQPKELARAQGFPAAYEFDGTREQVVKQIGNAVPVNLARALCCALLGIDHRQLEAVA